MLFDSPHKGIHCRIITVARPGRVSGRDVFGANGGDDGVACASAVFVRGWAEAKIVKDGNLTNTGIRLVIPLDVLIQAGVRILTHGIVPRPAWATNGVD